MPVVIGMVVLVRSLLGRAFGRKPRTPYGNRLPPRIHDRLSLSQTVGRRVVVIGDVHGCASELDRLLAALARPDDLLVVVGDLVNKGPASPQVLRLVQERGVRSVRGNHDDQALAAWRAWDAGLPIPKPAKHGWVQGLHADLACELEALPFTLDLPAYGVTIVHAGLLPGADLRDQPLSDLFTMRDVVPASTKGAGSPAPGGNPAWEANAVGGTGQPWAKVWAGPHHVLFGHDAARRLQLEPYATGLDTGCVYGGQLTACVLPALDHAGKPVEDSSPLPEGLTGQSIRLQGGKGIEAQVVSLPSAKTYSDKFLKLEQAAQVPMVHGEL
ncbi:hypothetical protein ACKKBG_A37415 [Auxenochlorella protothecoides x Auxenochlorella symbiontica]